MENQSNRRVRFAGKLVTEQKIREQFGKSREVAAATFNVRTSTFARKCKALGIKWPYPQRKSSRSESKPCGRVHRGQYALIGENVLPSYSQSGSKNKIASTNEETSQLLQMAETLPTSSHQRKNQNSDIPIRQAIEGNNMPNSIIDHMGAQSSIESVSAQQLNSVSSIENIKSLFYNLIELPLEDLSNPENETSMRKALSILADNLSLFSEGQAEQILQLSVKFPVLMLSWREYSRSHKYSQKSSAETEKIRDLVKRDEGSFKARCEELENKEMELRRQLEAVKKEKAEIAEQRREKSKQTKDLMEKEALKKRLESKATGKLENLSERWAKQLSFLVKLN